MTTLFVYKVPADIVHRRLLDANKVVLTVIESVANVNIGVVKVIPTVLELPYAAGVGVKWCILLRSYTCSCARKVPPLLD